MLNSKRLGTTVLAIGLLACSTLYAGAQEATAPSTATPVVEDAAPVEKQGIWQNLKAKFGGRKDGKQRGHHGEMFHAMFMDIDADKNGAVTIDEINTFRAAKVAAADTSKDGAVSLDEFTAAYQAMMKERTVRSFQRLDTDGDGSITSAELDASISTMFAKMDRNDDGEISKDDRPEKGRKGDRKQRDKRDGNSENNQDN